MHIFTRRSLEQYRDNKRDLLMVFINLEGAYYKILREVIQKYSKFRGVLITYNRAIKYTYNEDKTRGKIVNMTHNTHNIQLKC